jgi:YesN/AraC family two-component response regulator
VLTDIVMPEMDGIELARRASELRLNDLDQVTFQNRLD